LSNILYFGTTLHGLCWIKVCWMGCFFVAGPGHLFF